MKKVWLFILVVSLIALFVVSCSQVVLYVCPDGTKVSDATLCRSVQKEEQAIVPAEPEGDSDSDVNESMGNAVVLSKDITRLLDKKSNFQSASYHLRFNDNDHPIFLKGTTLKTYISVPTIIQKGTQYDALIVDLSTHTGSGYCERERYCESLGFKTIVDPSVFHYYTPLDWVDEIQSATKIGENQIKGRPVWVLLVNGERTYYVDVYYGVPLKVEIGKDVYLYDDMVFNKVEDVDVQYTIRDLK